MKTWSEIYIAKIDKRGGLLPFILNKEKRSAGALIERIKKKLNPGSKILEIGTGTGAIGALLIKNGYKVTGIDIDKEMLSIAERSFALFGENNKVFLMDAQNTVKEFGKNSFDLVITHGMLEHFFDGEIRSQLNKQLELAPMVISVIPMKAMSQDYRARGLGNERYLSTLDWIEILKEFHLTNIYGFGFIETNHPYIPEKLLRNNLLSKILAPFCAFNEFWITKN